MIGNLLLVLLFAALCCTLAFLPIVTFVTVLVAVVVYGIASFAVVLKFIW